MTSVTIGFIILVILILLLLANVILSREEAKGLREQEIKRLIAKKRRESGD